MKDRRKMYQDIWPAYSPRYAPKTTLVVSLFILIVGVIFLGYRYSVINWPPRFIKSPVEIQQEATPKPPQERRDAFASVEWREWQKKFDEINAKVSQANQALIDAMPATEAERKRYKIDESYRKEVDMKMRKASEKINETWRMRREHKEKRPPAP